VEDGLDLAAQRDSKIENLVDRCLRVPVTDTQSGSELQLPIDSDRASKFLAFDASGAPIAAAGTSADLGPVSSFIDTLLDDTTAADARTTLGAAGLTGNETIAGNKTFSGNNTYSGISTFSGTIAGGSPLVFEGATADDFETTLSITDPTVDRTVTIPNASGTVLYTATKAVMEAATSTTEGPTAATTQNHPGVAKAWVRFAADGAAGGAACTISASYNVDGVIHNTTGQYTITLTTDFSSAVFCAVGSAERSTTATRVVQIDTLAAGTCLVYVQDVANNQVTSPFVTVAFFGDQ